MVSCHFRIYEEKATMKQTPIVSVFGSAKPQPDDSDYIQAEHLGKLLAETGCTVINWGYGRTMGAVR